MTVQTDLCRTWSETPKTGFLASRLIYTLLLAQLIDTCKICFSPGQGEQNTDALPDISVPNLELAGNPSLFNVYALVRRSLLERCMKEATKVYQQSVSRLSESDTDDDGEERSRDNIIKIPKVC